MKMQGWAVAEFVSTGTLAALRSDCSRVRLLPLFDIRERCMCPALQFFESAYRAIPVKIAIPTFGSRVSPRFDCAQSVLIVTVDNGQLGERKESVASSWAPYERINKLVEFEVDALVCGGIDCWSAKSLESAGITIYAGVTGEIEDALAALVQGDLYPEEATVGGSRCAQQHVFHDENVSGQNRGSRQEPIPGGGKGRRQRAGRRGGARWGASGD